MVSQMGYSPPQQGKHWRQEQEETSHMTFAARKQTEMTMQPRTPAHKTLTPAYRVFFSLHLNLSRNILRNILKASDQIGSKDEPSQKQSCDLISAKEIKETKM